MKRFTIDSAPFKQMREGSEEPSPKGKGKSMTDTEKECNNCKGDCPQCSKKKKKGKTSIYADGFMVDTAQLAI